jgi:putative transposase
LEGGNGFKKRQVEISSDERVLGSTSFIEGILKEAEKHEERKSKGVSLDKLMIRISKDMGINRESITVGGRSRKISRARAVLAYIWVRYLGRSGYALAKALGVSPQAIYASSSHIEGDDVIKSQDIERWCN